MDYVELSQVEFFKHLMKEQTPTGILSIVSDTWDFWKLVTEYLPQLKDEIMSREGKVVIRPDSGDPVKILCGDIHAETNHERLGLIGCLWETFGGTITDKGYKLLDEHIGAIYGDSITLDRQEEIIQRLTEKGFAPTVVLGIGSYTYQYVTRDTHGSAVKATNVLKNNVDVPIFKDPKTDPGKKSAKGLLRVNSDLTLSSDVSREEEQNGLLTTVFLDGKLTKETSLKEIRELVKAQI